MRRFFRALADLLFVRDERDILRAERDEALRQLREVYRRVMTLLQEEMARRPDVSDAEKQIINAVFLRLAAELGRL